MCKAIFWCFSLFSILRKSNWSYFIWKFYSFFFRQFLIDFIIILFKKFINLTLKIFSLVLSNKMTFWLIFQFFYILDVRYLIRESAHSWPGCQLLVIFSKCYNYVWKPPKKILCRDEFSTLLVGNLYIVFCLDSTSFIPQVQQYKLDSCSMGCKSKTFQECALNFLFSKNFELFSKKSNLSTKNSRDV